MVIIGTGRDTTTALRDWLHWLVDVEVPTTVEEVDGRWTSVAGDNPYRPYYKFAIWGEYIRNLIGIDAIEVVIPVADGDELAPYSVYVYAQDKRALRNLVRHYPDVGVRVVGDETEGEE